MNIFQILQSKGFDTVPEEFYDHIEKWKEWYKGNVTHFHDYTVYTGQRKVNCHRFSLGMAKKVSEDWANLEMNEKVAITLEGEKEQTFFDDVCQQNNFRVKANEMQELGFALGTYAFVPRVKGVAITPRGTLTGEATGIGIDYISADNIFPLSWDNGRIVECAFGSRITSDNDEYYYIQIHRLNESGTYDIENSIYSWQKDILGERNLKDVKGFENIPEVIHTGSKERQFVIGRPNIANNIDPTLPMGISVYANAIDQLKGADIAYDSYVNEYVLGKKRIMVKLEALRNIDGDPAFDANDVVFYELPEDSQSDTLIREINMEIRSNDHNVGVQDMLNALSAKCGFGENHYKFNQGSIATATQIVSENSTLFRTIKKHELILEDVLNELVHIVLRLGNTYMNAGLNEDVEISVDFDDSIIEDKQTEFSRDMTMLSAGIIQPYEFRMKWLNEDEETAKAALPSMEDMISGEAQPKAPTEA